MTTEIKAKVAEAKLVYDTLGIAQDVARGEQERLGRALTDSEVNRLAEMVDRQFWTALAMMQGAK